MVFSMCVRTFYRQRKRISSLIRIYLLLATNFTVVYGLPFSIAHFMIIQRHNRNDSGFGGILQVIRAAPALHVMFVVPYRRFPLTHRKREA